MRSTQRALALSLLVLCGILAGYVGYRTAHRSTLVALSPAGATSAASASVTGDTAGASASSAAPASSADAPGTQGEQAKAAAVPEDLPDIRMPDLNGTQRSLHQFLGHPLIVNFWATWCEPCRREMPLLQQLWTQYHASGLQVVGIAVDSPSAVQQYLRHTKVDYPLLAGEDAGSAAVSRFGIEPVLPFSVFADASGQIVAVKIGELHRAEADYIVSAIEQVTQGHETLPQARAAIATKLRELAVQRARQDASQSGT
jgi:peroxiredoxin